MKLILEIQGDLTFKYPLTLFPISTTRREKIHDYLNRLRKSTWKNAIPIPDLKKKEDRRLAKEE